MNLLWSLHDMTPSTMPAGLRILRELDRHKIRRVALLVIPGAETWDPSSLAKLKTLQSDGYTLVAHGWSHKATRTTGIYERVHAALFSRDVAEHFSKSSVEIAQLMNKSIAWFEEVGLLPPSVYVPPAWTAGKLRTIYETSFPFIETLSGFRDTRTGDRLHLPLIGFQAFARLEATALTVSNLTNTALANATGRPARVAIHPFDSRLNMSDALRALMEAPNYALDLVDYLQAHFSYGSRGRP